LTKKLVFVIDDEPAIGRIVRVNLERDGYAVETSQDSVEALGRLQAGELHPDLILSDVTMPYMDGFELLTHLKADEKLKDIPVVLVTARSRDADIITGEEFGAARYMTKPIILAELFNTVHLAIGPANENSEEDTATGG
jgi:CheY-like chemotaxis protein